MKFHLLIKICKMASTISYLIHVWHSSIIIIVPPPPKPKILYQSLAIMVNLTFTACMLSNREREYPTVNMSPESNVTFDHSHVTFHWSVCSFQARDSPKTYSTGMYGSSTLSFSIIIYSWCYIYMGIRFILGSSIINCRRPKHESNFNWEGYLCIKLYYVWQFPLGIIIIQVLYIHSYITTTESMQIYVARIMKWLSWCLLQRLLLVHG